LLSHNQLGVPLELLELRHASRQALVVRVLVDLHPFLPLAHLRVAPVPVVLVLGLELGHLGHETLAGHERAGEISLRRRSVFGERYKLYHWKGVQGLCDWRARHPLGCTGSSGSRPRRRGGS
jgi:hypothetical protein